MGEVVLDGSDDEDWMLASEGSWKIGSTTAFISYEHVEKVDISHKFYSNNFEFIGENFVTSDKEQIGFNSGGGSNYVCIRVLNSKLQTQDTTGFKQWLSENPTTVVYQLAEPVIEEVETDYTRLMLESYENATVYFNSHIFPTSTIRYQANVISTSEIMSVSDQQDAMIIDNATQIAMITLTM